MEDAAGVAQEPVRDHLDPIKRTQRAQAEHAPVQDEQPAVPEHAHLAAELVREVGRHLLERHGARGVDGAEAALDHQVREREVVPEARVDLLVALAPQRVDGAVAARDRDRSATRARAARSRSASRRPPGSCPRASAAAAGRRRRRRAGSASGATRCCKRVRLPLAVGVRERHDVHVGERPQRVVLGVDLAAARRAHELDAALGEARARSRRCRRSRRPRRRRCAGSRAGSRARARSRACARSRRPRCRPRSRARRAAGSSRPRAPGAGAARASAATNSGYSACVQTSAASDAQKITFSTSIGPG